MLTAAFATVAWFAVVGYAWQTFLGSRIEQCLVWSNTAHPP